MKNFSLLSLICLAACLFSFSACRDIDDFYQPQPEKDVVTKDYFDFSTVQNVDLIVDYSDFDIHGPVWFRVYSENPIINENEYNEYVDERIEPVMEAYTDERGIFDATVSLPAYAKVLHVVTGNFMIGLKRMMVEVVDGQARVKLGRNGNVTKTAVAPSALTPGELQT